LKISTWNVNNGTAAERTTLLREKLTSDLIALQECSQPAEDSPSLAWIGDRPSKGLSLSYEGRCRVVPTIEQGSPSLAAMVEGSPLGDFNVLVVWAKQTPTYFDDVMATLDARRSFLSERPTVVLGDFNLDVRIRETGRQFYVVNARLNHEFNLFSAYHEFTEERFGMETMPTLYYLWGYKGCFHCDFIYVPAAWLPRIAGASVAPYRDWESSDHRPVSCEII